MKSFTVGVSENSKRTGHPAQLEGIDIEISKVPEGAVLVVFIPGKGDESVLVSGPLGQVLTRVATPTGALRQSMAAWLGVGDAMRFTIRKGKDAKQDHGWTWDGETLTLE